MSGEPVSSLATLDFLTHRRRATTFCFLASIFRKKLLAASMTPILQIVWRFWQCFRREVPFNLESTKTKCDGLSSLPFVTCIVCGVAFRSDHGIYSKQGFGLQQPIGCSIIGISIFHSPLCIEIASAQIATHLMLWVLQGLLWIHRIKTLNRVGLQVGVHVWLESLSNLPKQLSRQLRDIHGWSSLATSQSVTVIFFLFIPFLHDHDWSTVERVYQVHVFQTGLNLRDKEKTKIARE